MQNGKRVVLIAGTPASMTATVIGLVKAGYAVECVLNGSDALERLDCGKGIYDAMVAGPDMGELEQLALNKSLKKSAFSELPLVLIDRDMSGMSAHTDDFSIVPDDPGLVARELEQIIW